MLHTVLEKNLLEFKNTLADEKRALTAVMEINEGSGNKRGESSFDRLID
jgi:hypothetical protein